MVKGFTGIGVCIALLGLFACNNHSATPAAQTDQTPKGELAFLLKYNGQMPGDVGFLTNHVVERRLANMLKDSFEIFMHKAAFDRPIMVDEQSHVVAAMFYADSERLEPSVNVLIDVDKDAIWVDYLSEDSIIEYADHPSISKPQSQY